MERMRQQWGQKYALTLSSHDPSTGKEFGHVTLKDIVPGRLVGNVALVSHPGSGKVTGRFWYNDLRVSGKKIQAHEGRECGPILCTQYTLHRNVLKVTAQMMPLGKADNQMVILQTRQCELSRKWKTVAATKVILPGWTAPFRVENWDATKDVEFKVLYKLKLTDGKSKQYRWSGKVRRDPVERDTIVVAAFTGNHNARHPGVDRAGTRGRRTGCGSPTTKSSVTYSSTSLTCCSSDISEDNLATHHNKTIKKWARKNRVSLVFTPTNTSWIFPSQVP